MPPKPAHKQTKYPLVISFLPIFLLLTITAIYAHYVTTDLANIDPSGACIGSLFGSPPFPEPLVLPLLVLFSGLSLLVFLKERRLTLTATSVTIALSILTFMLLAYYYTEVVIPYVNAPPRSLTDGPLVNLCPGTDNLLNLDAFIHHPFVTSTVALGLVAGIWTLIRQLRDTPKQSAK